MESDPAITRVTVVLNQSSDWHKWLFIRKDSAQKNDLWQYVNPDIAPEAIPSLQAPAEPELQSYQEGATSLSNLSAAQQKLYQWEYERWERKDVEYRRQRRALAEFNSEISKTVAAAHLYLIEQKDSPHERLRTLQAHLAPTDATRCRDLIAKYRELQTPPRGRKVADWLKQWVKITNMCSAANLAETSGSRAQEDFLIACKTINPEYGLSSLRELIKRDSASEAILSVENYVTEFSTYLKITRPFNTGLNTAAAKLKASQPRSNTKAEAA